MKTPGPIEQAPDPDLRSSWPALRRAVPRARELALRTGTALVVSRNGVIEYVHRQSEVACSQVQARRACTGEQP